MLFTLLLFLLGYIAQQRSLTALQRALPAYRGREYLSNILPPEDDDYDDNDGDDDDGDDNSERERGREGNGWMQAQLQQQGGGRGGNVRAKIKDKGKGKPWAYVQFVNNPHEVCPALMVLARMHNLGSVGARVLLYPRAWDADESLGLARGLVEQLQKLTSPASPQRGKSKLITGTSADAAGMGAGSQKWVKGEYRPVQDQRLISQGTWPGEDRANRWEKTARRLLLDAVARYGVLLIPVDPLPHDAFLPPSLQEQDPDPDVVIKEEEEGWRGRGSGSKSRSGVGKWGSGDLSSKTYARSQALTRVIDALSKVITPLHLFNLTRFSRVVYLSPLCLPMHKLDELVRTLPPRTKMATPRRYWAMNPDSTAPTEFSPHFFVAKPDRRIFAPPGIHKRSDNSNRHYDLNSPPRNVYLLPSLLSTNTILSWLDYITPHTPILAAEQLPTQPGATGGTRRRKGWAQASSSITSLGVAQSAAADVLTKVFSATAVLLPAYPWHLPVHEDVNPVVMWGRRHGGLLGAAKRWDAGKVKDEVYVVVFTGREEGGRGEWPWVHWGWESVGEEGYAKGKGKGKEDEEGEGKAGQGGNGKGGSEMVMTEWERGWWREYARLRMDVCLLDLEAPD